MDRNSTFPNLEDQALRRIQVDDAIPIFRCSGKPEAVTVNGSGGAEEEPQKHMDHISEKGFVFDFHCDMVRKPIAIKDAMKNLDAEAAADK